MSLGVSRIPFLLCHHFTILILISLLLANGQITFLNEPYIQMLDEETPVNTSVLRVSAMDLEFSSVTGMYTITSNEFIIHSLDGTVTTNSVIDREEPGTPQQYEFDVTYESDIGNIGTSTITISIRDINDNAPSFTNSTFYTAIPEYTPVDTTVYVASATDADTVSQQQIVEGDALSGFNYTIDFGRVLYYIVGGNGSAYFDIDMDSGEIKTVRGDIDFDSIPSLALNISAKDGPGLTTYALLFITIQDINDNPPIIIYPTNFSITLSEAVSVDYILVENVTSSDLDHGFNAEIAYSISTSNQSDRFSIDPTSGRVVLISPLDRDLDSVVLLTILATDAGTPPLSSNIVITITLTDVNDNTPTFSRDVFMIDLMEDISNGSTVYEFDAIDGDEGLNGTVRYSLSHSHFHISPDSGVLSLIQTLDRESTGEYNFTIIAFDFGTPIPSTGSAVVVVTVLDVNDNSPIFNSSYFELHLLDTESPILVLSTITAEDIDSGSNGDLTYSFTEHSTNPFAIDSITGDITLTHSVSYSLSNEWYNYTVNAMDSAAGSEQRFGDTALAIRVHEPDTSPPVFSQSSYNTTVPENTSVNTDILTVTATDVDRGINGQIRYSIADENSTFCYDFNDCGIAGTLGVNPITGNVFVSSAMDRDLRESLSFQIIAYDGGFPVAMSATTNVTIFLLDAPDTAPQFQSSSIQAFIHENVPTPHYITDIVVVDPDLGNAGQFSLQIDYSVLDGILFILNSTTGGLYSNSTFDRETRDFYQLSIIAEDLAQIPLTSYLLVNITILDENDNSPFLLPNSFNRIIEAKPIGTVVESNLTVLDNDIGLNAKLSYSTVSILPENHFTIDNNTGFLYTDFVLDITVISSYNICILVQDNALPYFNISFCIEIRVLDGNFNPPIFSQTQYNTSLLESSSIGFVLINLLATDSDFSDDNNLIFYFINSTFPCEYNNTFSIDNLNGSISLSEEIDRENIREIVITVIAIDQPRFDLAKSAIAYVTVYVEDVNEFAPYFATTNASIVISEGVPSNTLIFTVLASDNDADTPNNEIRYSIAPSLYSYYFYVEEITGNVYTQTDLDRETVQSLSLTFIATDLGILSLNSTFILFIDLSDINDNSPQLANTTLYSAENQLSPYTIGFLQSVDNDSGSNGTLHTMFLQDNLYDFTLDNVTGELISLITFDRENTSFYNLTVVLIDSGTPQLQSIIQVIIIVTDVNDNPPIFLQESYEINIREDISLDTFIISVTATDGDIQANSVLTYTIGNQDFFQIESDTGSVLSIYFLDFEFVNEHVLLVYATDGLFTENTTLTIYLLDVNDNPPVFIHGYQFVVKECASAHTHLGSIETTDRDFYEDNKFTEYSIDSQYFSIHSESGLLKTLQAFDPAIQKQYIITVIANNTLAEVPQSSMLDIYIYIEPVADRPKFSEQIQNIEINVATQIGALIYTFQVLDYPDDSIGVSYSIQAGNIDYPFYLNSSTGELVLQEQLDYYERPLYALSIVAIENINFRNASTILNIYVTNYELKFPIIHYQISLSDNFTDTQPFLEFYLFASDHPLLQTDALMFEISSGDDNGIFSLTNSGALSVLNHSHLQQITQPISLTVSVADNVGQTAETNVTISISGIALMQPVMNFRIFENITNNSLVGYIPVYDSISILSGNDGNIFQINSGEITVLNSTALNYERQSLNSLSLLLQNATLQVYAIVNIELIDVNEFEPVFASDFYYFSFQFPKEYQNITFPLAIFDKDSHQDDIYLDIEDNDDLLVYIHSNGFIINETATNISKTLNISLKIDNKIIDFAYVMIHFQSYETNSNQPAFNTTVFSYIIQESDSFIGQRLDVITATDADQGIYGQLSYGLSGDHNDRDFIVHPFTGLISINFPLDYETQTDYNLVLYAYDSVSPCLSASTRITVTLLDSNDNSPIFQQDIYSISVLENSTVGTDLLQVVANDEDSIFEDITGITGDFGLVMYRLSPNSTDFSINSLDGVVSITLPLDREITSQYNLSVVATDGGGLSDEATIIITVLDVNDNPPMFENSTLIAELLEHAVIGTEIGLFIATDPDAGVNAFITYEIIEGNDEGLFYIDPVTHTLHSNASFDREINDTFMITILARDTGEPQLTSQVDIVIRIIDINDNSPEFSQSLYNLSILETLPVGTIVLNLTATDLDSGTNSMLFFSIFSGNLFSVFSLDPQSGALYLEASLDYEIIQDYTLIIQATDGNVLQPRSANATVLIYVINANDNFPVFSQPNYTVSISESIQADTFILQVMAFDNDQGPNASLFYSLDFSTEPSTQGLFYIEHNTGRIFVADYNFDFEAISLFSFQVLASDNSATPLTTAVFVYVQLVNENDNIPIFPQNITQLFIDENLNFPILITTLNATDLDGDSLAYTLHKFTTESECILLCGDAYQCQESIIDQNDIYNFNLLENSGEFYSNATFDRELRDNFLFILSASDLFHDPSFVCISIDIIDVNDNPPIPVQTEYSIDLPEDSLAGEFLTLLATDIDAGPNSDLFWVISSVFPSFHGFLIHPMLGRLTLIYTLDRETVSTYLLNITVYDNGLTPLQASIAVYVNVTDVNDNEPLFDSNNQTVEILESAITGDIVIQLTATDIDIAGNALITYSLTPNTFFDINSVTGEVYVASELDYETITGHNLIVTARDNGLSSLYTNTTLVILIIDSNDNPPVFSSDVFNTTLIENIIYNESILNLTVTDADTLFDNTHVILEIIQIVPNEPNFYISGYELRLSGSLDAEISSVYELTIQATNDIPINNLVAMSTVYVYISDENDNPPSFTSPIFFGSINEASPIGYSIVQVSAEDNDVDISNSEISFTLEMNSNSSFFSINSTSGEIELKNSIDFEISAFFTFNAIATDNGFPTLSSSSIILITVVDSNDNPPYFTQIFSFSIQENSLGFLGNVTGADVDNNTNIEYEIASVFVYDDSNGVYYVIASDTFSIDPVTGLLSLLQQLDREIADTYLVEISISDSIHVTFDNVTVYISDINDNIPMTDLPSYIAQIYERNDVLDSVFTPVVTDLDIDVNALIIFKFTSRYPTDGFTIDSNTGEVLVEFVFDRETRDVYTLEIEISDFGTPALTSYTTLQIQVLDVNDNIPVISQPSYQFDVVENPPLGLRIENFNATDNDIEVNGEFEFFLNDSSLPFEVFTNGTLYVDGFIDFESIQVYNFSLFVRDLDTPSFTDFSQLSIRIFDANDNAPMFDNTPLIVSISEYTPALSTVFTLRATDIDSTINAEYYFAINQGNTDFKFSIDEFTGEIFTIDTLNFELTELYELTLLVIDRGNPPLYSTELLEIRIIDENDNMPMFSQFDYQFSVREDFPIYTSLYQVYASDIDSALNGLIEFSIDLDDIFSINSTSGEIQLLQELNFEESRILSVEITAKDNGNPQQSSTAYLHIQLLDVNEYSPNFPLTEVVIFISNSILIGSQIFQTSAYDLDYYGAPISYELVSNPLYQYTNINPQNGEIYIENIFTGLAGNFTLLIQAFDGDYYSQMSLNIVLHGANAFSLSLSQPSFYFSVPDNSNVGSTVAVVTGDNVDRFYISTTNTDFSNILSVTDDGDILLLDSLASQNIFSSNLFAMNSLDTIQSVITIEVFTTQNNAPLFSSLNYYVSLSEALPIATTFLTVYAVDNDVTDQGVSISYTISDGDEFALFFIDSQTGRLSIAEKIDRESTPQFNLTIRATGNGIGMAYAVIIIDDVNDNAPVFSEDVYRTTIVSDIDIGTLILQAIANDNDAGRNGDVSYAIVSQPVPGLFVIDSYDGDIRLNSSLIVHDFQSYTFFISSADNGLPLRLTTEVQVYISIDRPNLYNPVFTILSTNATIPETTQEGTLITFFTALDPDTNTSDGVYYSLSDSEYLPFSLSNNGELFLVNTLDYLLAVEYRFIITATDSGTPTRNSTLEFVVFVEDINNHLPIFSQDSFEIILSENYQIQTPFITISATDLDATSVTYVISLNSYTENGEAIFSINSDTGVLSLAISLDYEILDIHELLVTARDHGYPITQFNSVTLTVMVQNVNDNPPVFSPTSITAIVPRLSIAGTFVSTVSATDLDSVSILYSILSGNGDGLFAVDGETGDVSLARDVGAFADSSYNVQLLGFDGELSSIGLLQVDISDNASYCYDGLCTDVLPSVTCTTSDCTACPVDFSLSTTSTFCFLYSCFSSDEYLCEEQQPDCISYSLQCNGVCIPNYSLCAADNLCYPNTMSSLPCDDQNTVCLDGYILVQLSDQSRVCTDPLFLSAIGQICNTPGKVYCDEIDSCQNIQNNPSLCQRCSSQEFQCPDTNECVSSSKMCCGTSDYFCNITDSCLSADLSCPPIFSNIAPTIPSKAIILPTSSSLGSVIGLLLGDGSAVGVDTQMEEVGVAIIGHFPEDKLSGYWQYVKCRDAPADSYGACSVLEFPWVDLPVTTSEDNAFILPPNYRIRFIRVQTILEGSVWLRLHLWDGFDEAVESGSLSVVREADPHFIFLPPFESNSAFSLEYLYFVFIFNPETSFPAFLSPSIVSFPDIQEDYSSLESNGLLLSELLGVYSPNLYLLSSSVVLGLPPSEATIIQNSLPSSSLTSYFSSVASTNTVRSRRLSVTPGFLLSRVSDDLGEWQVTATGRQADWYPIASILGNTNTLLYIPIESRVRLIPNEHTHGTTTVSIHPWDGTSQGLSLQTETIREITYLVSNVLSPGFALGDANSMSLRVVSVPDNPVVRINELFLPNIPYFIQYQRYYVFVIELEMSVEMFQEQQDMLSNYLAVLFHSTVSILYFEPLGSSRCSASFRLEELQLSLSHISSELDLSKDVLISLGFDITKVSQDTFVGQGYGCFDSSLYSPNTGESAGVIASSNGDDGDDDTIGLAVVLQSSGVHGIWQYYRSDVPPSQYNPLVVNWITFPDSISETNALLLRPSDWARFSPNPRSYWLSSTAPTLTVKLWDTSVGSITQENDMYHANTDPYSTTIHSTVNPIGLFSTDTIRVSARRQDCAGSADSNDVYDACCVCGGPGTDCMGCGTNASITLQYDTCRVCGGDDSTCASCDLVPFSYSQVDEGFICRSDSSNLAPGQVTTYYDCEGTPFGLALVDDCNVCTEGYTDRDYNYLKDCDGVCSGTASITSCGLCTGGSTGLPVDYPLDCRGICFGNYSTDSCGVCQQNSNPIDYTDCSGQCFGDAKTDQCGTCYGGSSAVPSADSLLDQCGVCGGDGTSCIGCDNAVGSEIDNCGECAGDNCECVKVSQLTPTSVLAGEETYVTVNGAGFFFKPDPLTPSKYSNGSYLPLCGGIRQYPGLDIFIPVSCIFSDNDAREFNIAVESYIDQSRIVCKTPDDVITGDYFVLIQFEDILNNIPIPRTPINTSLPLRFFDNSVHQLSVVSASLSENLVGIETELFFDVINFEYFPQLSCIISSFASCGDIYSNTYTVSALFIHSGKIMCVIPPADYPCQVYISISINNQIAGIIPQRDFPFSFLNTEPVVIQCKLEENLNSILIQFDLPLFLNTDISNGCSALFDSSTLNELGSSLCYFIGTSNEYILIQLSTDAMLTYSSELVWKDDSIYSISQTNSFPLSTPTSIQLPDSIDNPAAIITGPEILPLTGSTYFSAHSSHPCGYKPFVYDWDIRAYNLEFDISAASVKLSLLDSTSDKLVLDSSDFIAGEEYTLILSVTNSFGVSSQFAEKLLVKSLHSTYPVIIVSNPVDTFNSEQNIYLSVLIDDDIGVYSFAYEWKLEQILPSNEAIEIDLITLISNAGTLLLPSLFLQPNFNYIVSVTVSFIELSIYETVSKNIFIETQSPISIIEGGNRQIGFNQVLTLDASTSIQHDGLYDWECFNTDTMLPCTDAISGITSVVELDTSSLIQEIQPNTLAIESSYLFILTQSRSYHAVTISVQNNDVIDLYASPLMYELLHDEVIVISARFYGYEDVISVYWQCEQVEGQGFIPISSLPIQSMYKLSTQSVPLTRTPETVIYRSQWNELNLFLPTSSVSVYQNYTFSINANNFKSSLTLYSNSPPLLGQLVLSKSNGQPLTSEILLEAKGFCDSSLTYEFYYIIGDSIKLLIQPRSVISTATFIPPLISLTQQTSITIFVEVYRSAGKSVISSNSFRINVLQGSANTKISSLLEITDNLISNQEYYKAISRVSTLIISQTFNSIHFPTNSAENLFTMFNTLSTTQTIPAYSSVLYLDLVRYLRVDLFPSDQINIYLQFLLRIARDVTSTLENIKVTPSHNFPSPVVVPFDRTIVLQFIDIIRDTPMTSQLDVTLLFTVLDEISKILCFSSFFGSQPLNISHSNLGLLFSNDYLYSGDNYCIGDTCEMSYIKFPVSLTQEYIDWECNTNSQYRCNGVCLTLYSVLLENLTEIVELSQTAQNTIDSSNQTKTGFYFDYNGTILVTEVFILSMRNPISGLNIELSENEISVYFGLNETQFIGDGLILCLYREEQATYWEVESFFPIQTITNSINCDYTHFTQYAVARLNYSPIITPAPTTTTPTPTNSTTRPPVVTTVAPQAAEFPIAVAVVPIIIFLFIIIGIIIVLIILFCLWKRKKSRLLELVSPSEEKLSEESVQVDDGMFFSVCTISKSGQEDLIGKLQFPPSSRLREIRNSLLESFPEYFEKKSFCFLTRQREQIEISVLVMYRTAVEVKMRCQIDPGTENNHFLRIVYDSEVLVRFVDAKDELFRTVFCCCGKIAFFECSRCHGQAYCSAECQLSDWDLHKSECILLTEKKKRQDVLRKTQSSVLRTSVDLRQKRELDQPQTGTKFDTWRAFLQSQGAPSDLPSSFPIREEPRLNMTDTQTEIPRISVAAARPLPLPPILGTIQHPLNKPAP